MAVITRAELKEISQRRSQQDLIDLVPRVAELLDLLDEHGLLPTAVDVVDVAATVVEDEPADVVEEPVEEPVVVEDVEEPAAEPAVKKPSRSRAKAK